MMVLTCFSEMLRRAMRERACAEKTTWVLIIDIYASVEKQDGWVVFEGHKTFAAEANPA